MLNSNPASSHATTLSLAVVLSFFSIDPAAAQEQPRLPSSFDAFFADVGRVAPLFTRPEVVRKLPPVTAAPEETSPPATASVEPGLSRPPAPSPRSEDKVARARKELVISPAEASPTPPLQETPPAAEQREEVAQTPVQDRPAAPAPRSRDEAAPRSSRFLGSGQAVWYQHPGRTASGETYNPDGLTAAHRTLPMGTRVRVVNKRNGRSVVVRINDRTPAKLRSTIDLSRGSARVLGIEGIGSVALYRMD